MAHSKAFSDFLETMASVDALLAIEQEINDPPASADERKMLGLRGAVAVLEVAAFEMYLREAVSEHLSRIEIKLKMNYIGKLPEVIQQHSLYYSVKCALDGPRYGEAEKNIAARIPEIHAECKKAIEGKLSMRGFIEIPGNADASFLFRIFHRLGLDGIDRRIHRPFEKEWKSQVTGTFIQDKLDEIALRRHRVAHTANARDLSRKDLNDSVRFLKCLCKVLDMHLGSYVQDLLKKIA